MKTIEVMVVRIYITEASHSLEDILHYLKNEAKIRGVSVFRAISGFGQSGEHSNALIDFALDLPLVVEFFDEADKMKPVLEHFDHHIKPEHMICWKAQANA
jgi:PII-like signaling protein